MNIKRALLFVLIAIIVVGGCFVSINGLDTNIVKINPMKEAMKLGLDLEGGVYVVLEAETDETGEELSVIMNQTREVMEKRVNALGLTEPNITVEGEKRIRVELPGVANAQEAIETIGKTAQLQFLDYEGNIVIAGKNIKDAHITFDQDNPNEPMVALELDGEGAEAFRIATKKAASYPKLSADGSYNPQRIIFIVLDDEVISAPSVSQEISGGQAVITGSGTLEEAASLAALIRGGALPVNLVEMQTSLIGPKLGIDSLDKSITAGMIGISLVLLFMLMYYRLPGFIAGIALVLYMLIVLWTMIGLNAVLTLPGIAALILSIGMAVDANVIIFERIKEELGNGKSIRASINSGFKRALTTILDANITTLIAGAVLYQFGTGAIKGFAVTLIIGIVASMFTAIVITKALLITFSNIKTFNHIKFYGIRKETIK